MRVAVTGQVEKMTDHAVIDLTLAAELPGKGRDVIGNVSGGLDVLFDFRHCAQRKFSVFVNRAEEALVPGTVARQPQQQAAGLIWGSNRALFEARLFDGHRSYPFDLP